MKSFFLKLASLFVEYFLAICAFVIVCILAIPVGFYGMYLYIEPELPSMTEIQEPNYKMPLQIYTKDKKLIAEFGDEISLPVQYNSIPKNLINAFLAAEDDTFFNHDGISVKGLGRAVTEIISNSDRRTGGSTITMQVAKNYFLSPERTFKRKLTELFLARRIEQNLTKEQILTLYVNKIYLGANAYGIGGASKKYYSKTLSHLTIAQMAMIAGLPKAPSQNNPLSNPDAAISRRNWILGRMHKLGYINKEEYEKSIAEELDLFVYKSETDLSLPYLAEWARYELVQEYGKKIMNSGWRIQLTVDSNRQKMAESALKKGLIDYGKRHGWHGVDPKLHNKNIRYFKSIDGNWPVKLTQVKHKTMMGKLSNGEEVKIKWTGARKYINPNRVGYFSSDARKVFKEKDIIYIRKTSGNIWRVAVLPKVQGALVAVNPSNGGVEAMAGGYDFHYSKFNRATQGWRQPGSIIKPLIYTLALEKGYRPDSMVSDERLRVGSWKPKNSDGRYYGKIPLRKALYLSRNLVSIRLLQSVGIAEARQFLSLFGLTKNKLPSNLTLALGTGQVLPIQMATAYATFANGGHRVQPHLIKSIYKLDGSLVYFANPARACAQCYNDSINHKLQLKKNKDLKEISTITNKKPKTKSKNLKKKIKNKSKNDSQYSHNATSASDRLKKFSDVKLAAAQAPRIISPRVAYDMASILKDVVVLGTGKRARRTGRVDIGGKTGTTNLAKDAWFAGFQPSLAAVVWVGYDIPRSLGRREYGGVAALPIWARFMRQALQDTPTQWVSSQNKSKSDKQSNKVVKVKTKGLNEEDIDLTYKSDFNLPPTAYYIRRHRPKTVRPKMKDKNQNSSNAETKKSNKDTFVSKKPELLADNQSNIEIYKPKKTFEFNKYNDPNRKSTSNEKVLEINDIQTAPAIQEKQQAVKPAIIKKIKKEQISPKKEVKQKPVPTDKKPSVVKPKEAIQENFSDFESYNPDDSAL